jgi:hypothetical protein
MNQRSMDILTFLATVEIGETVSIKQIGTAILNNGIDDSNFFKKNWNCMRLHVLPFAGGILQKVKEGRTVNYKVVTDPKLLFQICADKSGTVTDGFSIWQPTDSDGKVVTKKVKKVAKVTKVEKEIIPVKKRKAKIEVVKQVEEPIVEGLSANEAINILEDDSFWGAE